MIAMIMIDAEEKKSMSNVSSALGTGRCQVGPQKFAIGVRRLLMTLSAASGAISLPALHFPLRPSNPAHPRP
jgi:hypothetical protein